MSGGAGRHGGGAGAGAGCTGKSQENLSQYLVLLKVVMDITEVSN